MTDRTILLRILPWVAILAMGFLLAACSSQKSEPPPTPPASQEPAPRSTPPEAEKPDAAAAEKEAAERMRKARSEMGDRVEIRQSWVQVRSQPSQDAQAIALAFGNDSFPVVGQEGDWVKVKLDGNRDGWIPVDATQER